MTLSHNRRVKQLTLRVMHHHKKFSYDNSVKNMMKKAQRCRVRFNDMLYQYRTSPVAGKRESPIELLEQRRPRTNMPSRLHVKIPSSQTTTKDRPASSNSSTRGDIHGKRIPR